MISPCSWRGNPLPVTLYGDNHKAPGSGVKAPDPGVCQRAVATAGPAPIARVRGLTAAWRCP